MQCAGITNLTESYMEITIRLMAMATMKTTRRHPSASIRLLHLVSRTHSQQQ